MDFFLMKLPTINSIYNRKILGKFVRKITRKKGMTPDICFFDIYPCMPCTPKFCHTYVITCGNFMVIVDPWKFQKNVKNTWRYYRFIEVYHKWRSYDVWFLRYKTQWIKFFVILGHFLPFDPPNNLENQNFEKMKKKLLRGIFILHMCTINENHMMHGSWDMECKRPNFFPFWTFFWPFTPLNIHKVRILKKMKKTWIIIILHRCTINDNHMMYDFWYMKSRSIVGTCHPPPLLKGGGAGPSRNWVTWGGGLQIFC